MSKIFVVDSNTSMTNEELSIENLLDQDMSVAGLKDWGQGKKGKEKECKILIYHTHASESFADSRAGKQEDTIVGVGSYLTEVLEEQYGVPVYHDTTAYDMIDGVLDRSKAYENAYDSVSKILADNPSIEVVIDLHRDGVNEETHLVTDINGKKTAKIMFLNGVSRSNTNGEIEYLKNPNKLANLAFSFQMYLAGREYYGDYVRKIYVKSLRFNLHLMPRTTLIEVGAQNNTLEEEKNAMEPLAAILNQVLSDEE
ncbi:MAG: stage II sporulation protein P [Lachnospiraceae bacterium]|nr:stage II sporulation protein P [Lachnospiraceae bacterium]